MGKSIGYLGHLSVYRWRDKFYWKVVSVTGRLLARSASGRKTLEAADADAVKVWSILADVLKQRRAR